MLKGLESLKTMPKQCIGIVVPLIRVLLKRSLN